MKPLTRKEMLLDGAAKGNLDDFKPATREEVFAKRALANAGGGASSWNDLTDKPITEIELLPITTFTIEQDGGWAKLGDFSLVVGKKYKLNIDGVVYALNCYVSEVYPTLGSYFGTFEEYPFFIYTFGVETYIGFKTAGEHSVAVSVETVDSKSIADMYYSVPFVVLADSKGLACTQPGPGGTFFGSTRGFEIFEGKSYTVVWDGVAYENLIAVDGEPGAYIGGRPSASLSEEMPFSIFNYDGYVQVNALTQGSYSMYIRLNEEAVVPIDEKYLPKLVSPNGTKYKIVVSDDGTLSATAV